MEDFDPVRVFISSKQSEFTAEREALADVIRGLPLLAPIIAEEWSPERRDVRERFLQDVRRSPIYVGLFGCVYSAPTVVEYETACENPRREILIYIRPCPEGRIDAQLNPVLTALRDGHVTSQFETVGQLVGRFERHLWSAVKRIIDKYVELQQPPPTAQGVRSVLGRLWETRRAHLQELGLPGALSSQDAGRWAGRLSAMLADRPAVEPG
jgi:hypothetical protein